MNRVLITITGLFLCSHLFGSLALAMEMPDALDATLFEHDTNFKKVLFRFKKEATLVGGKLHIVNRYVDPLGVVAVEEKVDYRADGSMESYSRLQNQINEETTMTREGNRVFFYKKEKGKESKDDEEWTNENLVTDQVHAFMRSKWDDLMAGKTIPLRLLVPSRTETVGFNVEKEKNDGVVDGKPAIVFKMTATSMIIRAIVEPVVFYYSKDSAKRLLWIDGRMPVKTLQKNGDYDDIVGDLVFNYTAATPVLTPVSQVQKKANEKKSLKKK